MGWMKRIGIGMTVAKYSDKARRGNAEYARIMAMTADMMAREPDCCSKSYLSQRAFELLGDYDRAEFIIRHLVASKAIRRIDGSRKGFPDVYIKGPNWHHEWVIANWAGPVTYAYFMRNEP